MSSSLKTQRVTTNEFLDRLPHPMFFKHVFSLVDPEIDSV